MSIQRASRAYETWLARQVPLVPADLRLKHQRMTESPFSFLRATFYRWSQLWPEVCPELRSAVQVQGVGDLHVENFGTWRDSEGRLIWGVNDFDEACWLPYPNDLVRLAVSAHLAVQENHLSCDLQSLCEAILGGYMEAIEAGGTPFVLTEHHKGIRDLALSDLRDPVRYWNKLQQWKPASGVPRQVELAFKLALPEPGLPFRVVHRQAGLGSLGRRRFTALAEWRGGLIAREAKELVASAWNWNRSGRLESVLFYQQIIQQAVRVPDPFCATPWQLAHATVSARLQPGRTRIAAFGQGRVKAAAGNGLGNCQYSSRNRSLRKSDSERSATTVRPLADQSNLGDGQGDGCGLERVARKVQGVG